VKNGAFHWFVHVRNEVYLVGLPLVKADQGSLKQEIGALGVTLYTKKKREALGEHLPEVVA
jgi:hypothetical protein